MGMANPTAIQSSLPDPALEDGLSDDDLLEIPGEDGDPEADQTAQAEGYADAAEKDRMEAEASAQGWRPLDQYRGKPGGWKSAKQFLHDGQNYLPFVQKQLREAKDQNNRMASEIDGLRSEVNLTRQQMEKLLDHSRKADRAGYERAVNDLKAQQRDAVAVGDVATFDKIENQLDAMAEAREEAQPTPPTPAPRPTPEPKVDLDPGYQEFVDENPWLTRDRLLNAAMIEEHNRVIEESPAMPVYDQLQKAKEAVMAKYPKKFGLPENAAPAPAPRRPAAPMRPSASTPRTTPRGDPANPIEAIADPRERAEAKAGYAAARRAMPTITPAEYLAIYNDPHADVLAVQESHRKGA